MQQDTTYGRGNQEKSAQPLLKVLVIEDEDNIVELIKLGLRYEGFQVEAASDGPEGISAAHGWTGGMPPLTYQPNNARCANIDAHSQR